MPQADELRLRPLIGGVRFTTTSPRNMQHTVQWVCGVVETIELNIGTNEDPRGDVTTYQNPDIDEKVMICRRGTEAANSVLRKLEELEQAQEDAVQSAALEQVPEIQRIKNALAASMGLGPQPVVAEAPAEQQEQAGTLLQPCGNPGAPEHYDCPFCDDPVTHHPPRHFGSKPALMGHSTGEPHKRAKAAARPAAG